MKAEPAGNNTSFRVVLADDHEIMREGLRLLLSGQPGIKVVAEAGTGREAVELTRKHKPDMVIMDVTMPDINGIDATRMITEEFPAAKVLTLSMHADRRFIYAMFRAGASGYMLKNSASKELLTAVTAIRNGETYVSPRVAGAIMKDITGGKMVSEQKSAFTILSDRERTVLQLLADGKNTKEIGGVLNLSAKTVETHRDHIKQKLGLTSMAELTKYAIREGITSLET